MSQPSDPQDRTPAAGPETTSLPVLTDALLRSASHRLTEEEHAAVDSLPPGTGLLLELDSAGRGLRFLLDRDSVQAGRNPDADIVLDDVTVSRRHAGFLRRERGFELVDARSLNGTYVNGDRVDAVLLRSGDEVRIGKFRFLFYASSRGVERTA